MAAFDPPPQVAKSQVKLFVSRRLRELGLGRIGLSEDVSKSLSYLSQIESGTTHFPDAMIASYEDFLRLAPGDAQEFRRLIAIQNAERRIKGASGEVARIAAILEARGAEVSGEALKEILRILNAELERGRTSPLRRGKRGAGAGRISPERFVEILFKISDFRSQIENPFEGLFPIVDALEQADAYLDDFDLQWVATIPSRFGDVWATVETVGTFRCLYLPEDIYRKADKAASFERHVLAHELTHVLLAHQGLRNLAPTVLDGRRSAALLRDDPTEELEANIGAVLLLLGWERMFKPLSPEQRALIYNLHRIERDHAEPVYFYLQQSRVRELIQRATERR